MFKQRKFIMFIALILISFLVVKGYTETKEPVLHSKSAILMDASTGKVLFEKNSETAYPVASISKLMTIYIVLDLIENGTINWSDEVTISASANDLIETAAKIPVESGVVLTVEDLFYAIVISSANNATIAMAEYITGTEADFSVLMNEKAQALGLSDQTNFINATGLPSAELENRMSANDVAILARQLLLDHEEVLETASLEHGYIESFGIDLFNTNKMLNKHDNETYFKEVDGLKTGYTDAAGFCFVSTATSGGQRYISVIINAETDEARFIETKKLLSYGFSSLSFDGLKGKVKGFLE